MTAVIGFAGYSNSGKTTLIARLVPWFQARGIRVAVIKHDAHGHYKEAAGSDSAQWIESGASAVAVVSPDATHSYERSAASLPSIIEQWTGRFDLILIEGFKGGKHPKIAVFRSREQAEIVHCLPDRPLAWVAADEGDAGPAPDGLPVYNAEDIESIGGFILGRMAETDNENQ